MIYDFQKYLGLNSSSYYTTVIVTSMKLLDMNLEHRQIIIMYNTHTGVFFYQYMSSNVTF